MADTFATIKSNYNVIMYKDMLHMIIENRFLAVGKLTQDLNHRYLFMALPLAASNDEETNKPVIFRNDSQKAMMSMLEGIENTMRDQHVKQTEALKKLASVSTEQPDQSEALEILKKV